jgi:biotin operon repressor
MKIETRDATPVALTDRQQTVLALVTSYYEVAREMPSSGWISRRLSISRKRAWEHVQALRGKHWLDSYR